MNFRKNILRVIALSLLICMCASGISAFAESATINAKGYVYKKPDSGSAAMKVKKGTEVEVLAVEGKWAKVEKDGNVAFIPVKYLDMGTSEKEEEKDKGDGFEEYASPVSAEVNAKTYAFKSPDSGSSAVKVKKGTKVNVLGVSGSWAKVEKGGKVAYMYVKYLDKANSSEEKPEEEKKPEMSVKEMFASGKYSNEELCYIYAVREMGYNTAAAAGLLANIKAESNFRVNANGDAGRSYGICQWFASRKTRLLDWCELKGYDPAQLYSQMEFLHYELESYYPKVDRYMKAVENTAEGAYDAAYYFCYNFEAPANKAGHSVTRGNSAQNSFFPKYA